VAQLRGSRFRSNLGARTARRKSSWEPGPGGTGLTQFSTSSAFFVGSFVIPLTAGLTIVRIRGLLSFYLTTITSVGNGFQGAFGIGIASAAAVNAGIASVPTPITELDNENWLYWTVLSAHGSVPLSTSLGEETKQSIVVDTKAMRKFDDGLAIYAAAEVVELGTAVGELFFDSRALALIP